MAPKTRKPGQTHPMRGQLPSVGAEQRTVIEGAAGPFTSLKQAYHVAKTKGLEIGMFAFTQRVRKGLSWQEILKPARHQMDEATKVKVKASQERKRAEMHELCMELDRRKAEINNG